MTTTASQSTPERSDLRPPVITDNPSLRPLLILAAIALPVGWLLLSIAVAVGLPQEPFVLVVTLAGLILPVLYLTGRESGRAGVKALLRDAVRIPRPMWWAPLAALGLPTAVWALAAATGGAEPLTSRLLISLVIQVVAGAITLNIWEELVWTGFVQRRAMARWGVFGGSMVTAVLFAGIHLPLAFDDASGAGDVLVGIGSLLAIGVGLRLLIAGIDAWSGRSLLTVGLLHASFNASADLIDPDQDWVRYVVTVVLGLVVLAVVATRRGKRSTAAAS